jgi:hypothetical protein
MVKHINTNVVFNILGASVQIIDFETFDILFQILHGSIPFLRIEGKFFKGK